MFVKTWVVVAGLAAGCADHQSGLAGGVSVFDVTVYQGPIVPLVHDGVFVPARTAPVLAGRAGRFVVSFGFEDGAEPRDVAVKLALTDPATGKQRVLEQPATIPGGAAALVDVAFDFDASAIAPGATFSAAVYEQHGFVSSHDVLAGARLPEIGDWPLDARQAPRFRVEIVPIAAPSGAPPIIDQARLDNFRGSLMALYPLGDLELTVTAPMTTMHNLTKDSEWNFLLGELAARRAAAGVDPDVFDFGTVGTVTKTTVGGIAASLDVELPYWRVAAAQLAGNTEYEAFLIAHELGHAVGRSHAPCGNPGGPDYAYPYPLASIGVPGLDLRDGSIKEPDHYYDFMSYCGPVFASDYQFGAVFESLDRLATSARVAPETPPAFVIDPIPPVLPAVLP